MSFNKKPTVMKKINFIVLLALLSLCSCNKDDSPTKTSAIDYKEEMRNFVIGISQYAKTSKANFAVIPQNGIELVTQNGEISGNLSTNYLNAIDGNGQEDLFYGYDNDDVATPTTVINYLKPFLNISKNAGNKILAVDYCSTPTKMDNSYNLNASENYISFSANQRNLNNIPTYPTTIKNENNSIITNLSQVQNFLYLINLENYTTKTQFINAVTATNYDALIMDLYFKDNTIFTPSEINQLKNKANGGKRIVISYMSIGEAENYRDYWNSTWNSSKPMWLNAENPNWPGNYKVQYWDKNWQNIIYGNDNSYLKKILNAGFDGVYLDIIDAFEYYEN